jgi:hypothetical protein
MREWRGEDRCHVTEPRRPDRGIAMAPCGPNAATPASARATCAGDAGLSPIPMHRMARSGGPRPCHAPAEGAHLQAPRAGGVPLHATCVPPPGRSLDGRLARSPTTEPKEKVRASTSLPRRDFSIHRPEVGACVLLPRSQRVKALWTGFRSVAPDRRAAGPATRPHPARGRGRRRGRGRPAHQTAP